MSQKQVGRVLAVDPGLKRLGIAISDPFRILATPLTVIRHTNIQEDCQQIARLASENNVDLIVVGQALGGEGEPTAQSRHSMRLIEILHTMTAVEIIPWDESESTQQARRTMQLMKARRKERSGHLDQYAAAAILQSYLDSLTNEGRDA